MYKTLNEHYKETFGCKVYKLAIDGGFTCPNRDGTCGVGGCIFCDAKGGGAFAEGGENIFAQLTRAKERVKHKNKGGKYIAYFQSFTGTYAPIDTLRRLYFEAIAPDDIVGLSIGTRPDCLSDAVVSLLAEVHAIKPVSIELGLQTANDQTARLIRRGYDTAVYTDAVKRLKARGIEVVTHIILGLPSETVADAVDTVKTAVAAGTNGVKFHLLHVLKDTELERLYNAGAFDCLTLEQYAAWLKACLAQLPRTVTVHRLTGDGAKRDLVAPLWSADKKKVLNTLSAYLR